MQIDFVIPWVNGNDPEWQKERNKYSIRGMATLVAQFREWDNLQYWFRGVEKFAPWVNRIHFVTCGHLPEWLNTENPKLHIVRHEDYIPQKYLPTFSSHPIELNFHRIEGLSDHFVYFNDDMFLTDHVSAESFFRNGLPCDIAGLTISRTSDFFNTFPSTLMNNAVLLNRFFSTRDVWRRPHKWLHPQNGKGNILRTAYFMLWPKLTDFSIYHLPMPYEKRTFEEVWAKAGDVLDEVCTHRFRSYGDINQYLFRYWRNLKGEFVPFHRRGIVTAISNNIPKNEIAERKIRKQEIPFACLNDTSDLEDFEGEKRRFIEAFNAILPEKSSFEK